MERISSILIKKSLISCLLLPLSAFTAGNCDLVINKIIRSSEKNLDMDIYASKAGLAPYKVTILEGGKVAQTWSSVQHKSGEFLKVTNLTHSGNATVRIDSIGLSNCYASIDYNIEPFSKPPTAGTSVGGGDGIGTVGGLGGTLITCSGVLFDPEGYLRHNVDVKNAKMDACFHFTLHGKSEGRSPNPFNVTGTPVTGGTNGTSSSGSSGTSSGGSGGALITCDGVQFDPEGYLRHNVDVKNAKMDACFHYTLHGKSEGRSPNPFGVVSGTNTGSAGGNSGGTTTVGSAGGNSGGTTTVGSAGGNSGGATGDQKNCKRGPSITDISGVTSTTLIAKFDGEEITGINYSIIDGSNIVLASGSLQPQSNRLTVNYPALQNGRYTLVFKGANCSGQDSRQFVFNSAIDPIGADNGIVAGSSSDRQIYMNLTGFGFSPDDPTGIDKDWHIRIEKFNSLNHNGVRFKGLDGIELTMKWQEYEPKEGSFRDDGILKVVEYCKKNGLKLGIVVWPYRQDGDGFLPDTDKVTGQNGTFYIHEGRFHLPAYYSEIGRTKLKRMAEKLAKTLEPYSDMVEYITMVYGSSLEHTNPLISINSPAYRITEITGYEHVNRVAFKKFSASYGTEYDPPLARTDNLPWSVIDIINQDQRGKLWYKFMSNGLKETLENFSNGIKIGSNNKIKTAGHFADVGRIQSAWYYTYDLKSIYSDMDIIYSSDGTRPDDLLYKLMAADVMMGTFPNKKYAIEFDSEDLSYGSAEYGVPLNPNSLSEIGGSFFRRGGNYLHFAMAFSAGEEGRHDQISQLAGAIWELRNKYIINRPEPIPSESKTAKLTTLNGDQFTGLWFSSGGSKEKQIKIIQESDSFWNNK